MNATTSHVLNNRNLIIKVVGVKLKLERPEWRGMMSRDQREETFYHWTGFCILKSMAKVASIDHLSLSVGNYHVSKDFYGKLMKFLGFKILDEYDDAIGWTNGKTRLWISTADRKGKKHRYRFGDVGFHHYAFRLSTRKEVDELQKFLKKMGAKIVDPAGEYYPNYYGVYFEDPDGLELEGMWYGQIKKGVRRT